METTLARKRFCKDFNLPIIVFESPYFEYFIDLYNGIYNTHEKYRLFQEVYNDNEQEFFAQSKNLIDNIRSSVTKNEGFIKLSGDKDIDKLINPPKLSKSIYQQENEDKVFISLDLKEANFQALKLYDSNMVSNCESWEDLVSKFTDKEYFKKAKQFRQVVFGELLPKKQQKLQFQIIEDYVKELEKMQKALDESALKEKKPKLEIYSISADEIILKTAFTKKDVHIEYENPLCDFEHVILNCIRYKNINRMMEGIYPTELKMKTFYLKHIAKDWYVEINRAEGKTKFKNCPNFFLPQIYKHYYNLPIAGNDLLFYHEGKLAKFVELLFPIEKTNT